MEELCWRQWGNLQSDGKDQKSPLNNLDLKREESPRTTEYLPPLRFEKGHIVVTTAFKHGICH